MAYVKKILIIIFLFFLSVFFKSQLALACAVCNSQLGLAVRNEIIHTLFLWFSFSIFFLFTLFFCAVFIVPYLISPRKKGSVINRDRIRFFQKHSLPIAGMLAGGAVAGFLDTALFHQILQTHAMVSEYLPITALINVKVNMFWDGVFEFFTLVTLLVSLMFLWHGRGNKMNLSTKNFIGWFFFGCGLFNFLEGMLNHEILGLHHVLQQTAEQKLPYAMDILFLLVALSFMVLGVILIKKGDQMLAEES